MVMPVTVPNWNPRFPPIVTRRQKLSGFLGFAASDGMLSWANETYPVNKITRNRSVFLYGNGAMENELNCAYMLEMQR
jgi:hypothetical protein